MSDKNIEVAIIGGGIAGVSAAIYAQRAGLSFKLFEPKLIGGQLHYMDAVDNYVGIEAGTKGRDLATQLAKNLESLNIEVTKEEITKVEVDDNAVKLSTKDNQYTAKTAIVATGAEFRKLGIPGEAKLSGKGVSYCAICDGFFFRNKTVAVVGGGNTAVEEALYLADICEKVYLIHRRDSLRAIDYLQQEAKAKSNIEILYNTVVPDIKGDEVVSEIVIENIKDRSQKTLVVNGIFIAIGITPTTDLFSEVIKLDEGGFIVTDESMRTSSDIIWSCGDCRRRLLRQLITAASEGAVALISAYKHLRGHYISA